MDAWSDGVPADSSSGKAPFASLGTALWTPDDCAPDSAWIEHAPFAFWLIDRLRPRNVVALGVGCGDAYFCCCQAVQRLKLATACCAADAWTGDGDAAFLSLAKQNERYAGFSTVLRATPDAALRHVPDGVDCLIIDGRRAYDELRREFETWRGKLAGEAIVLLDDIEGGEDGFGARKLFDELKRGCAAFAFPHGRGLGAIAVKAIPEPLQPLFAADASDAEDWRRTFAELGRNAAELTRARRLEAQLQEANERSAARAAVMVDRSEVAAALVRATIRQRRKRSRFENLWWRIRAAIQPKKADIAILRRSLFLDEDWYHATHADAATLVMGAPVHYLTVGAAQGLDPGPFFSTRDYLVKHPGVAKAGLNPLLHFEKFGWRKGQAQFGSLLADLDRLAIRRHIADFARRPLISVVMPVYDPPVEFLRQAIESVIAQAYPNWELCVANDASRDPEIAPILDAFAARDSRIRVVHRAENGHICVASNSALDLATGEFVALMDHDDLLHETALYEAAAEINRRPDVDVIYSDEDMIDEDGDRFDVHHKTDFNPELLLGQNMVCHLGVYRRSLIETIGRFRPGLEGAQDYDLALRAWEASSIGRIRHIPAALYHWRQRAQTRSFSQSQLDRCTAAARQAIQAFLDREGEGAKVVAAPRAANFSRVVRQVAEPKPLVSAIVLTKDRADLLSVCADGVLNKTDYPNLELLIVDHESKEPRTRALFETLKRDRRVRILPYAGAFNYPAMNNMAVAAAKGSLLALLNNDIEVIHPEWLTEMVSHAVRLEVGAVGAKLYYPDGRIQHAGVVVGMGAVAGHSFQAERKTSRGRFGEAVLARSVSAVTAACLVIRKSTYLEVNGLDAEAFPVAYNDVDFCLKVQAKGYRNVWTPFAELVHHESVSRGRDETPEKKARFTMECANFRQRWSDAIANDPCFNPNLSLHSTKHEVAPFSRRKKPWAKYL